MKSLWRPNLKLECKRGILTTLPVSYRAGVKPKLIIISQQSLLHMAEVHWLAVDEYKPHTPLEGWRCVTTVQSGTAWMEMTHCV